MQYYIWCFDDLYISAVIDVGISCNGKCFMIYFRAIKISRDWNSALRGFNLISFEANVDIKERLKNYKFKAKFSTQFSRNLY